MRIINTYITIASLLMLGFTACSKDETAAELNVAKNMLSDKTWYLDYSVTNNINKSYVGQTTYFINFLKSGLTNDSDGIKGSYLVQKPSGYLQIQVTATTISGTPVNYTYNIVSVGNQNLILSYTKNNVTTQLYYSTK
jgi:hypothetical protein